MERIVYPSRIEVKRYTNGFSIIRDEFPNWYQTYDEMLGVMNISLRKEWYIHEEGSC